MDTQYRSASLAIWPAPVLEALEAAPGEACFDMDGTLLMGDIGEHILLRRQAAGLLHPDAHAAAGGDIWQVYSALMEARDVIPACALGALALVGMTEADVEEAVDEALASGGVTVRAPVLGLVRAAEAAGHRVWVVTGSPAAVGRVVARHLGLDPARVIGVELEDDSGVYSSRVKQPVPAGTGKLAAIEKFIGAVPLIAVGDSIFDLPMLSRARAGVGVPLAGGALIEAAAAAGVPVRMAEALGG